MTIPTTLADLTPEWLTTALSDVGHGARVRAVTPTVIGESEGWVGLVARLALEWDVAENGRPVTVIVKLPTSDRRARAGSELLGVYEREIRFYQELAPSVPIRVPHCYYGAYDPGPAGDPETVARQIDRLPKPILTALHRIGRWAASRSTRRYVLLLEDLAPAKPGNQVERCSPERLDEALATLGTLHRGMWQSPTLTGRPWLGAWDAVPSLTNVLFRRARRRYEQRYGEHLPPHCRKIADWLTRNSPSLARRLGAAPPTLVHGDYRLDNLFFGAGKPAVADWQIPSRGPGVFDVAYLLSSTLEPEATRDAEHALVRRYHAALTSTGTVDYAWERCWTDYRRASVLMLERVIGVVDSIEFDSPRGRLLMETWTRRLAGRLTDANPDALLAA